MGVVGPCRAASTHMPGAWLVELVGCGPSLDLFRGSPGKLERLVSRAGKGQEDCGLETVFPEMARRELKGQVKGVSVNSQFSLGPQQHLPHIEGRNPGVC